MALFASPAKKKLLDVIHFWKNLLIKIHAKIIKYVDIFAEKSLSSN